MTDESWKHPLRQNETGFTLTTKLEIRTPDVPRHLDWLTRFMMASVESSGVLSAELLPSPSVLKTPIWTLAERFHTAEQIEAWLDSEPHRQLMNELEPYLKRREVVLSTSRDPTSGGSISVAVVTRVKEGQEAAYLAYERQYQAAQAIAPGYHGAYVQPPAIPNHPPSKGGAGTWITILRFDSPQAMDQWFASEARHTLLAECQPFVQSTDFHPVTTSFPSWLPEEVSGEGPSNWKMALLILLGTLPQCDGRHQICPSAFAGISHGIE